MTEDTVEADMSITGVYHSLDSILQVLRSQTVSALPEVQELLNKYKTISSEIERNGTLAEPGERKLFVVFEGLDGSGKTTVSREVAKVFNGVKRVTPPESIADIREKFDKHPTHLRRAFYGLGNYIAAKEVETLRQKQPVFMDRFWHSTTAYGIANELQSKGLTEVPAKGHAIYCWPSDLLRPDLVLFLQVDEATRAKRHARRKHQTKEEEELVRNDTFRQFVLAAYECMTDPPFIIIDSSRTVKKTVADCVQQIRHRFSL